MAEDKLSDYRKKRKASRTDEPTGAAKDRRSGNTGSGSVSKGSTAQPRFVVQRHDASSLHLDFRLEIDGVLVSWAVPKGPSVNPADTRLAHRTEDHPLDYADFEGRIEVKVNDDGADRRRKPAATQNDSVLSARTNADLESQ